MLVELGLVEQRYQAVLEVLNDGATVTDVARRYGVARQTVHEWLRKYAAHGLGGLADRTSRPLSCPHQMPARARGPRRGDASGASGLGTAHDLVLARTRGRDAVAGADVGGALLDPPRARHAAGAQTEAQRLQALGTQPGDGAVADGHRRWCPARRWQ